MQHRVSRARPRRPALVALALFALVAAAAGVQGASAKHLAAAATPRGDPIVVGSTLSLTGAFGATGAIHKVAGETYVRWINANGGLLGRPVQWRLLDDESDPAKVSALYERLISQDKVDLIMGPYATPNIVAAQAVAERHGYVLPNHTAVLTYALNYRCQFPTWSTGGRPNIEVPRSVFQALKTQKQPPKRVAFVSNSGGSTNFVSYGPPSSNEGGAVSEARKAGFDVVLDLKYPPDVSDWGSIAAQVRAAQPDLVWNSGLALDPVNLLQAMRQLNYKPKQFFTLFPAPGPLLAMGSAASGVLSLSLFEPNGRLLKRLGPKAQRIVANFGRAAAAARLPYRVFDTQAAASWTAWEALVQGVQGAKSLDQQRVCAYLLRNGAKSTFIGNLKFNQQQHNFPQNVGALKQIQDGRWKVVYPVGKRDAKLLAPGGLK